MTRREEWAIRRLELDVSKLVFVDESWASTAMAPTYGWSLAGDPAIVHRPLYGKKLTAIGAMAVDGPRGLGFIEGGVRGETFVDWIHSTLGPNLRPGDQVVMDNLRVHHMQAVKEALAEYGAMPMYLPAYSPELNPIEHIWGIAKAVLRTLGLRDIHLVQAAFEAAWNAIESSVWRATVEHCGYAIDQLKYGEIRQNAPMTN